MMTDTRKELFELAKSCLTEYLTYTPINNCSWSSICDHWYKKPAEKIVQGFRWKFGSADDKYIILSGLEITSHDCPDSISIQIPLKFIVDKDYRKLLKSDYEEEQKIKKQAYKRHVKERKIQEKKNREEKYRELKKEFEGQ